MWPDTSCQSTHIQQLQETSMESVTSDAHAHVEPGPSTAVPPATGKPLKIRWGRLSFALVGFLALLTAGISGALSIFSLGTPVVAWTSLAVFFVVLAVLRTLAVREYAARRAARFAAGSTANAAAADARADAVVQRETALFDRAEGAEPAPVHKPLTAEELRAAALRVAAKGTADAKLAHTQTLAGGELAGEPWEPIDVPVPGYVTANRALSLEKPLVLPDIPKSAGTSIKADQAGVGVAGDQGGVAVVPDLAAVPDAQGETAETAEKQGKVMPAPERGGYALINLDDVLQRRRA
jgi:hypothetical protein